MGKLVRYNFETIKNVPYSAIVFVPPVVFHQSSFYKITYIEGGTVDVEFVSKITKKHCVKRLSVGDAFIITPKDIHRYMVDKSEGKYHHRDIYVDVELMKSVCDFISPTMFEEINLGEYPNFFKLTSNQILALGESLSPFINSKKKESLDSIHKSIVTSILGIYCINKSEKNLYPEWLQDILRNLGKKDFLNKPIEEIVKTTNYSHSYVLRIFKKYLNVSLKQYIISQKLAYSTIMLLDYDSTLENIATSLNFSDSCCFIKAFKKKYGIPPGEYRKKLKENQTGIPFVDWGEGEIIDV